MKTTQQNDTIPFRGRTKPGFYCGRNTGNTSPIWAFNPAEQSLELLDERARTTSGSFNLANGRDLKTLPTKRQVIHLLPEWINGAQMWVNFNRAKYTHK